MFFVQLFLLFTEVLNSRPEFDGDNASHPATLNGTSTYLRRILYSSNRQALK